MQPPTEPLVQTWGITKIFPGGVVANEDVSFAVWPGTLHAVIGENGAGKTTLMNVLYGRLTPDRGRILVRGEDVRIDSPARAIALGFGLVAQHTTLIPALSALDNVILGAEPCRGPVIDRRAARVRLDGLAARLGIQVDWQAPAGSLSVAARQKVEIVKALFRGASILILDEPTATLAPQEAEALFALLRSLVDSGATVLLVTHKLPEVMAHTDRVTVLRGGRVVGERITAQTYREDLLALMIGQRTGAPAALLGRPAEQPEDAEAPWQRGPLSERLAPPPPGAAPAVAPPPPALEVRDLSVAAPGGGAAVRSLALAVRPGEILGVAGVDGSGQRELAEAIVGLLPAAAGTIRLAGKDITRLPVMARRRLGVAFVPEDRLRQGLILDFTVAENFLLGRHRDPEHGGGLLLKPHLIWNAADRAIQDYRIRAAGPGALARTLSGGNQQKLVMARALSDEPVLLVALQPTRGLDVEAARFVHDSLRTAAQAGTAILLCSLDLDELLEVSHSIAVLYNGGLAGVLPRGRATQEQIGRLMLEGAR